MLQPPFQNTWITSPGEKSEIHLLLLRLYRLTCSLNLLYEEEDTAVS